MRYSSTHNAEHFNAIADKIGSCADGTFCIVAQLHMIEMFAYERADWAEANDPTVYYDVRVSKRRSDCEDIALFNSSYVTANELGPMSLAEVYGELVEHVIFDSLEEANAHYVAKLIELNTLHI